MKTNDDVTRRQYRERLLDLETRIGALQAAIEAMATTEHGFEQNFKALDRARLELSAAVVGRFSRNGSNRAFRASVCSITMTDGMGWA